MYLEHPRDAAAYEHRYQYFLGEDILVSPITTPGEGSNLVAKKTVWFPAGHWFNMFSGERFEGRRVETVLASIDEIPLYVRGGTPVPMQPYTPRMTTTPIDTLIVRCYPGNGGESVLYEDDGQSNDYLEGRCAWTRLVYRREGAKIFVKIDPVQGHFKGQLKSRGYRVELSCTHKADSALLNGVPVPVEYHHDTWTNAVLIPPRGVNKAVEVVVEAGEIDPAIPRKKAAARRS
jgi:alpha-glucosidase (family GH31 glycosyl hydrolase)